ncbi:MAG: SIS domain-containing protein [bacterium]|nr:MAG: SIS domain-containing protein [bacterium]
MNDQEIRAMADYVWEMGAAAITCLKETIDRNAFADCVRTIAECRGRVVTAGVGTSGAAAKKIAHSLSCIECPAFFLDPGDAVHGALGSVQPEDVAILISKGGGTREIVNIIPALQTKSVQIIGVTEKEDSVLGRNADILLRVRVEREADDFNMLATTSTLAVMAVFDAICIVLMSYTGYTREQFALIHPGGAVGERLLRDKEGGHS